MECVPSEFYTSFCTLHVHSFPFYSFNVTQNDSCPYMQSRAECGKRCTYSIWAFSYLHSCLYQWLHISDKSLTLNFTRTPSQMLTWQQELKWKICCISDQILEKIQICCGYYDCSQTERLDSFFSFPSWSKSLSLLFSLSGYCPQLKCSFPLANQ